MIYDRKSCTATIRVAQHARWGAAAISALRSRASAPRPQPVRPASGRGA